MTTILIILFVSVSILSYTHIKEKQLEKELLKLESELESTKPAEKLYEELKDYYNKKSRR